MNERTLSNNEDITEEKNEILDENGTIGQKEKLALYSRSIAISVSQGLVGPFV